MASSSSTKKIPARGSSDFYEHEPLSFLTDSPHTNFSNLFSLSYDSDDGDSDEEFSSRSFVSDKEREISAKKTTKDTMPSKQYNKFDYVDFGNNFYNNLDDHLSASSGLSATPKQKFTFDRKAREDDSNRIIKRYSALLELMVKKNKCVGCGQYYFQTDNYNDWTCRTHPLDISPLEFTVGVSLSSRRYDCCGLTIGSIGCVPCIHTFNHTVRKKLSSECQDLSLEIPAELVLHGIVRINLSMLHFNDMLNKRKSIFNDKRHRKYFVNSDGSVKHHFKFKREIPTNSCFYISMKY